MPDTAIAREAPPRTAPTAGENARRLVLKRRFPTVADLREAARRRLPRFAFEYLDGGAGADNGIARNWAALNAVELAPRYGNVVAPPPVDTALFGRAYAAPIGIAPIGSPGTAFPGAERCFAAAAEAARVPYTLGVLSGLTIEEVARIAPSVAWLQMYRFPNNDHRIGFDLVRRAEAAGIHVLVMTIDTPIRTTRPREVRTGVTVPFRLTPRIIAEAVASPHWFGALLRNGSPKFVSIAPYMGAEAGLAEAARFIQQESGGAFTWEELKRYRDAWRRPMVLKGVLHPDDAARAVALGLDGVIVSNHGGRQIEALPASIDALPAIAAEIGGRATIILDSGIRSGTDVARALALGADAAFAGKAFLWSLGALGAEGPGHLINVLSEELAAALGQLGCARVDGLRSVPARHPGAWRAADFAGRR